MGDDGMTYGDETGRAGPWVVVLTSHLPYHASGAWLIDEGDRSEQVARDFAKFVTSEIDPAVALPLRSAASELLSWRSSIASPAFDRYHDAELLAHRDDTTVGDLRELFARPWPGEGEDTLGRIVAEHEREVRERIAAEEPEPVDWANTAAGRRVRARDEAAGLDG